MKMCGWKTKYNYGESNNSLLSLWNVADGLFGEIRIVMSSSDSFPLFAFLQPTVLYLQPGCCETV